MRHAQYTVRAAFVQYRSALTMPIDITDKIVALLAALSPNDIEALPPVQRRGLADGCRRAAALADPPRAVPHKGGVLLQLGDGYPRHE
jgi:hypothetical protein